jgi:TRAP-type C4-dicarboxylate transport system permease small subunit
VSSLSKIGQWITRFLYVVASLGLLVAMMTVVINVVGRAFLGMPLLGTVEVVGLTGVFLIPLAMVVTEAKRRHIEVEMVTEKLPQHVQRFFSIGTCLVSLFTVGLLVWGGVLQVVDARASSS